MKEKYRMYVDEVGNSDLKSAADPNHRFLSLTGIIIKLAYVRTHIHPQIEQIKQKFFDSHPDEPLVLHRKELMFGHRPFEALKNHQTRTGFDEQLLSLLRDWHYTIVTVVVDKKEHLDTYGEWAMDPYHYALRVLMERFVFFLDGVDAVGDILAESRGGRDDMRLKHEYTRIFEQGSDYLQADRFAARLTSRQLKVKPKIANIAGLQLADLLAHPSRVGILLESGKIESGRDNPFARAVINILRDKYYRKGDKVFGKKVMP